MSFFLYQETFTSMYVPTSWDVVLGTKAKNVFRYENYW